MSKESDREIKRFIERAVNIYGEKEVKKVLLKAAKPILDMAKANAPVAKRKISRYDKNGNKVATYYPGNLIRSLQWLPHLAKKHKNAANVGIWIGALVPKRSEAKGEFTGDKVDGWYAHIMENGNHLTSPKRYWQTAIDTLGASTKSRVAKDVLALIRKNAKRQGIS